MNSAVGIRSGTSRTSTGCHNEGARACLLDIVRLQHKGSVRDAISADLRACRLMPRATRAHMEERAVHGSYRHFGMNSSSPDLRVYPRYPKLAVITRKPLEAITRPKGLEAMRGVRRVLPACLAYLCEVPNGTVYGPRGASESGWVHILVPLAVIKGLQRTRDAFERLWRGSRKASDLFKRPESSKRNPLFW